MRDLYLGYEDVARLEGVPEPLFRTLMAAHATALTAAGLDPAQIGDPQRLWAHRDRVPAELIDAIHRVGWLADPAGVDQIVYAAGGPLFADPCSLPVVTAVRTLLQHPDTFDRALGRRFTEALRPFREFVGPPRTQPLGDLDLTDLADGLRMGLGRDCRLHTWRERDGSSYFCLEYAGYSRLEREADGGRRVVAGPTTYDLVVYDPGRRRLRVFADGARVTDLLASEFGFLLHARGDAFRESLRVTLDPLAERRGQALEPTVGVLAAKVVRLEMAARRAGNEVTTVSGADVLHCLSEPHRQGPLRAARLRLQLRTERRPREVDLQIPDVMAWDWRRGDRHIRTFLEERGFLVGPSGGASWLAA
ncbi:MAG: hypothetical protein ABMB14_34510 [Myxococcota bacterium]